MRQARQEEIDDSIARRAATEYLCDDAYEDTKRVRVSGPFSAESLSPHRVLAPEDQDRPATERAGEQSGTAGEFVSVILDSLRKSGIKGTDKAQAIRFDRLEPFSGSAIHEAGEYTTGSKRQRVAVAIGPQYGTVGPDHIKEAAKEAVQGPIERRESSGRVIDCGGRDLGLSRPGRLPRWGLRVPLASLQRVGRFSSK